MLIWISNGRTKDRLGGWIGCSLTIGQRESGHLQMSMILGPYLSDAPQTQNIYQSWFICALPGSYFRGAAIVTIKVFNLNRNKNILIKDTYL